MEICFHLLIVWIPYDIVFITVGGAITIKKLMILFVLAVVLMSGCAHSTIDESSTDSTLTSEELRIKEVSICMMH